ncbi:MAG: DUF488 domain-containing protein [Proteobacteria bacterium]|nr:DUF488 domain-containing protein [Pseudomonadota bacterium]
MNGNVLYTIGYEGSVIEAFITTLQNAGVSVLVDVRDLPISRKPGFSKKKLEAALNPVGIKYVHFKGLGNPKNGRLAARSGNTTLFHHIYAEKLESDVACDDLRRVAKLIETEVPCLLCFEKDHKSCHRDQVANKLMESIDLDVRHIDIISEIADGIGHNDKIHQETIALHG